MFALSRLLEAAVPVPAVPRVGDELDLRSLMGKEYRFPVPSVPAIRLPKNVVSLGDLVNASGPDAPFYWAALTSPVFRVPLLGPTPLRRAALLVACTDGSKATVALVNLAIQPGRRRHEPPELVEHVLTLAHDHEDMLDLLEQVWIEADPAARAAAGGAPALWLGGDPVAQHDGGDVRVASVCAALGLDAEIVRDASRHVRQIASRVSATPPAYLIVWRPAAQGIDSAIQVFRRASAEGQVIELHELTLPDALLELRWALVDLGLMESTPLEDAEPMKLPPEKGEERFYIKLGGSKAGDVMVEVADCGHGQWGSDVRRLAPRAHKGIASGVKSTPRALFRCSKCSKHRWRARY